jgi:hypothetical protein
MSAIACTTLIALVDRLEPLGPAADGNIAEIVDSAKAAKQ